MEEKNVQDQQILEAKSYRDFIRLFFITKSRPLSYRQFANRAGYASKSHVSEIISGRKRMTLGSFPKVVRGLGLDETRADFFYCLIALEEPDFRQGKSLTHFESRLLKLKKRIVGAGESTWFSNETAAADITLQENCTDVCVAIGDPVKGATEEEIGRKTALPIAKINEALNKLLSGGLVRKDKKTGRYHNIPPASNIRHSYKDAPYQEYVQRCSEKAIKRMPSALESECLYSTQTITINRDRLPSLREKLNQMIRECADDADQADGTGLAEIFVTLTHNFDRVR